MSEQKYLYDNKLELRNNSELGIIKLEDNNGNSITYSIDTLYKCGRDYSMCEVHSGDGGIRALVDIESAMDMIRNGYISNAFVSSKDKNTKYICKRQSVSCKKYKTINIKDDRKTLDELEDEFIYVVNMDNIDTDTSYHRLKPTGMIFDLGNNPMVVLCVDTVNNNKLNVEINRYLDLSNRNKNYSMQNNKTKYKTSKLVSVSTEQYNNIRNKFGQTYVLDFKVHDKTKEKLRYEINIDNLTFELAGEIFGYENIFYAIPKPEMFDTRDMFIDAMSYAAGTKKTAYCKNKYMLTNTNFDRKKIVKLLKLNYEMLNKKLYFDKYNNIVSYILGEINKDKTKAEKEVVDKIKIIAEDAECGCDVTEQMKSTGLMVLREDIVVSDEEYDTIMEKIREGNIDDEFKRKYMRVPTIDEATDLFGLQQIGKGYYSKKKSIIAEKNKDQSSVCIESAYLDTDGKIRIEIRRDNNKVYARLVNENTNDDVIVKDSIITYEEFINNGINKTNMIGPLKRAIRSVGSTYKVEDILDEILV